MVSRRLAVLLSAVALAAVVVGIGAATGTPEPILTIENENDVEYHVTAYTVEDMDEAGYLNFEVTTEDGDQRILSFADLVWPNYERNVTLVDDGVESHEVTVEPGENVTTTVDGWEHGEQTIYIVEEGENRTHVATLTKSCTSRGQDHGISFSNGSGPSSSTVCTGEFVSWMFR
ncbi:hypothetical protein [Natrialba swarupiae]|uniref:Uncharacterized protein n=1 Tax=Natrialba swarupiae TaxID=2448032 RepID=A0A5D5ASD9_9EURY|nr:hypothetical protein [Natrialba swarupiae]MCW8171920.1 hypothetical protein [Natrialba swarupiae]TYT63765.1 hypothetical protein FYC77_00640 [Natrialba swarupiae]